MEKSENFDLPLISIITVVLNGAKTIEQTIQSVIYQSYLKKEYIIIDGGSTDGTQDIIRKYNDHIRFWKSEPDKGIFDAMNKGILLAKGDLIGIINADDWYEKDILRCIADTYQNSLKNIVIHGLLRNYQEEGFYSIKGNSTKVLKFDMIQHPTCFIPKDLYLKLGVYDSNYQYTADFDLVLRYLKSGVEFLFLEKVIANFRIGGVSLKPLAQRERLLILEKYKLISKRETAMRLTLLYLGYWIKSIFRIK